MLDVAVAQFQSGWNQRENIEKAHRFVRQANGAKLLLLSELFLSPYFCSIERQEYFKLAMDVREQLSFAGELGKGKWGNTEASACEAGAPESFLREMSALAKECNVVLPVSFFERAGLTYYNSVVVFDADGKLLHPVCRQCPPNCTKLDHCVYRKSHIPTGPGYQEKYFFSPSPSPPARNGDCCGYGFKAYRSEVHKFTLGIAICWDQWFPEARILALKGAEILLYPTAIGSEPQDPDLDSREHWQITMRGHAGANLMPLLAANRIGEETNTFYGRSFIADASGQIVEAADDCNEALLRASFDLARLATERASWGLFRDRRVDLFGPILERDPLSSVPNAVRTATAGTVGEHLSLPSLDGFRMPAEWDLHRRTWMAWPYKRSIWRQNAKPVREAVARVVEAIASFEEVVVLAKEGECLKSAQKHINALHCTFSVRIVVADYDDLWTRDTGPTFVTNHSHEVRGIDWNFNGWGGKFVGEVELDTLVGRRILAEARCQRYKCPINMEGGSFHVDGTGTLLTTAECLLNKNRNPQCSKEDLETQLRLHLGVSKFIWLPFGIDGDADTDGHVDNICSFVRAGEVALAVATDPEDPQHCRSQLAFQLLQSSEDVHGRRIKVHELVHPPIVRYEQEHLPDVGDERTVGERVAISYANFYLCNGAVIIPGFFNGKGSDAVALQQMCRIFPERRVVQVQTFEIALGGGNIHCITQQEPL